MAAMKAGSSRKTALDVLLRVEQDGAYADRALDAALKRARVRPEERGLVTELVYGTLRQQSYLDFIIGCFSSRGVDKLDPVLRVGLRLGAHQLVAMRVPSHAAVHETVGAIGSRSHRVKGFANAVLRKIAGAQSQDELPRVEDVEPDPIRAMSIRGSHPEWFLRELHGRLGDEELAALVEANTREAPLMLRTQELRGSRDELCEELEHCGAVAWGSAGIILKDFHGSPTELDAFASGLCTVQDGGAQLVAELANPGRGARILDLCAAPGGKSTHLAELSGDEGKVLACDIHAGRTRLIGANAERLGLTSVEACICDATDSDAIGALVEGAGWQGADVLVVDAPCSGLGTLRRHPELRLRKEEGVAELVELQRRILSAALAHLAPGGTLVYSVCTQTEREGWAQARWLAERSELTLLAPEEPSFAAFRAERDGIVALETWPHRHDLDGFFAVRFRKK